LKNIFYEFGTLLHCFNDRSPNEQTVIWPVAGALHQLRYQLHSVEGRAKCPTVPQRRELLTSSHAAVQGSKSNILECLKKLIMVELSFVIKSGRAIAIF